MLTNKSNASESGVVVYEPRSIQRQSVTSPLVIERIWTPIGVCMYINDGAWELQEVSFGHFHHRFDEDLYPKFPHVGGFGYAKNVFVMLPVRKF
jgi:hypothetical protein